MIRWAESVGLRFGKLTVLRFVGIKQVGQHSTLLLRCDCGTEVERYTNTLRKSAACPKCQAALMRERYTRHGMRGSPEYSSWRSAKDRCHNEKSKDYVRYGAKGIHMHPAWRESFEDFMAHIGPRPDGTSLDRIDNSRGYEPGNVRWATQRQQAANRRNSTYIEVNGRSVLLADYARELGITTCAAHMRLKRGKI
jgi:hypothetical protein